MWDDLTMKEKAKYMKEGLLKGVKGGINNFKSYYNDNVRPKVTNTYDANDTSSFEDAYAKARTNGNKTFIYKGNHYNTDYSGEYHKKYNEDVSSGKQTAWESQYPNYTNPNLRRAKQEELDTYGITNEQTRDRNIWETNLVNNLNTNNGYNQVQGVKDAVSTIVEVLPSKYLTIPEKFSVVDEQKHRIISESTPIVTALLGLQDHRKHNINKQTAEQGSAYGIHTEKDLENQVLYEKEEYDLFNMLLGKPQKYNTMNISEFRPTNAEHPYYIKSKNDFLHAFDSTPEGGALAGNYSLGTYTIDKGEGYNSYYDLWDINPLGQGSDTEIINLGTPINIYDRTYKDNVPNIDSLYRNLTYDKHK